MSVATGWQAEEFGALLRAVEASDLPTAGSELAKLLDRVTVTADALAQVEAALAAALRLTRTPVKTITERILDLPFVVSNTDPSRVRYALNQTASPPLLGSASSLVELVVNDVVECQSKVSIDLISALTQTADDDDRYVWTDLAPGDVVLLRSTIVGNATATLLYGVEVVF